MALTGWTRAELGRQPASVVRALAWRTFAAAAWDRDLRTAAESTLPADAPLSARIAQADAQDALAKLRAVLFPEAD